MFEPYQWALLYLAVGAAYLATIWHRRGEAPMVSAMQGAVGMGMHPIGAVVTVALGLTLLALPLWPVLVVTRALRGRVSR